MERYTYFVRKVADFQAVWGLNKNGWATVENKGARGVPLWPEREFAEACTTDEWADYVPKEIALEDFLKKWLPGLERDGKFISVFPVLEGKAKMVSASTLLKDLLDELDQYE